MNNEVLKLSNILISNHDLENFQELLELIRVFAQRGERFLQFDVKPEFPDTPEDWEDRLEAAFSGRV
ncbi:sulfur relay protein DsrC [Thiolapillus sp.]